MINYIFFSLMFIPVLLFSSHFYCKILAPEKRVSHPFAFCCIFSVIAAMPTVYLRFIIPAYGWFLFILTITLPAFLFFGGTFLIRLTVVFIAMTVACIAEMAFIIPTRIIGFFVNDFTIPPINLLSQGCYGLYFAALVIYILLQAVCFYILENLYDKHRGLFTLKTILQLDFPVVCTILASNILSALSLTFHLPHKIFMLLVCLYLIINFICFLLLNANFNRLLNQEKKRITQEKQALLLSEQLAYPPRMEDAYQAIRKWNHDYMGHLLSLSYLMEQKKYDEVSQYITEITKIKGKDHEV